MRKRVVEFLILASVILAASSVVSQTEEDINKAMLCLDGKVAAASSLSLQEAVFASLAGTPDSKLASTINSQKSSSAECWPKTGCKIKDTAQVVIAKNALDEDTSGAVQWLLSKKGSATGLTWYLQITPDNNGAAECVVGYDSSTGTIKIDEKLRLSGSAGSCLSITSSGYWLEIKGNCVDKVFEISCLDQDFKTNLLYQKAGEGTIFVSSKTNAAAAKGVTTEEINAKCFKDGGDCDYEASLWATTALYDSGENTDQLVPYLRALSPGNNQKYFPSSFLRFILPGSAGDEHYEKIIQLQEPLIYGGLWKIANTGYNQYYDSALAMVSLGGADAPEVSGYTVPKLFELQDSSGCWNSNNIRDTAFIIYAAGWQREEGLPPGATCSSEYLSLCLTENDCTTVGGFWYNNKCNKYEEGAECDLEHLGLCSTNSECTAVGGYWYNNECNEDLEGAGCDAQNLNLCTTPGTCLDAGGYWYNNLCHEESDVGERDIKFFVKNDDDSIGGAIVKGREGSSNGPLAFEEVTDSSGFTLDIKVGIKGQYYIVVSKTGYPSITKAEKIPTFSQNSQDPLVYTFELESSSNGATECNSINLNLCIDQTNCTSAGGYWYDDICNKNPVKCDIGHLNLCLNETNCTGAGGYWYDNKCNKEKEGAFAPQNNSCYLGDWYNGTGSAINTIDETGYCHLPDLDDWPKGCCPTGYECDYDVGNESSSICVKKGGSGGGGGPYSPGGSTICETAGYYCVSDAYTCIAIADGDPLQGYDCNSYAEVCCTSPEPEESCTEKSGRVCAFDEECTGSIVEASDGSCCLDTCELLVFDGDDTGDVGNGSEEEEQVEESRGSLWIWIIVFMVLILLVILGIVYRDKIRVWLFKMRGKTKTSKITPELPGSGAIARMPPPRFGVPPQRPGITLAPRRPIQSTSPIRPMTKPPEKPTLRKKSEKDKEMEETLRKLKKMTE